MIWLAVTGGLKAWSGAVFRLAFGLTFTMLLVIFLYAAVISVSPAAGVTLAAGTVLAGLALAGWWRFCGRIVGENKARPRDLIAGFTHPRNGVLTGLGPLVIVGAPVGVISVWLSPALFPLATAVLALAAAAVALTFALPLPFHGMALNGPERQHGRLGWPGRLAATFLVIAIAALGPVVSLLLESQAVGILADTLPTPLAPFSLGIVRLAGAAAVVLSLSAASCVWASACELTRVR